MDRGVHNPSLSLHILLSGVDTNGFMNFSTKKVKFFPCINNYGGGIISTVTPQNVYRVGVANVRRWVLWVT